MAHDEAARRSGDLPALREIAAYMDRKQALDVPEYARQESETEPWQTKRV
jgi:hypothetical protein